MPRRSPVMAGLTRSITPIAAPRNSTSSKPNNTRNPVPPAAGPEKPGLPRSHPDSSRGPPQRMPFRRLTLILLFLGIIPNAQAQLTNAATRTAPVTAVRAAPKLEVRTYQFLGDTILPPEKIAVILSNYT